MCVSAIRVNKNFVSCRNCWQCKAQNRLNWVFRLTAELHQSISAHFITLTYADEYLPLIDLKNGDMQTIETAYEKGIPDEDLEQSLNKEHLFKFFRDIRKKQSRLSPKQADYIKWFHNKDNYTPPLRYYAVGEYGTKTGRPHYHAIIFNMNPKLDIADYWHYGFVKVGTVTEKSIKYVTKYVINNDKKKRDHADLLGLQKEFSTTTKHPYLGYAYVRLNKTYHENNLEFVCRQGGKEYPMPKTLRDRIFDFPYPYENYVERLQKEKDEKAQEKISEIGLMAWVELETARENQRLEKMNRKLNQNNIF